MTVTRNVFCEFIVRDFAKKYLKIKEPFELKDIMKLNPTDFPRDISDDEIYTLADVRFCMRSLRLVNSFSHIRIEEYKEIETKEVISNEEIKDTITLYEILGSLPAEGSYIRRCPNCGTLFVSDNKNRKYCYGFDKDGAKCDTVGYIKIRNKSTSPVERAMKLYSKYYKRYWAQCKKGELSEADFELWKINSKNKCADVKDGKLTYSQFEKLLEM